MESNHELLATYNASIRRSQEANGLGNQGSLLADEYAAVMEQCMELLLLKDMPVPQQRIDQINETFELLEKQLEDIQSPPTEKKKHGGSRAGAGKKRIGVKQGVTMTLPPEDWAFIDRKIQSKEFQSLADYFRKLHERYKEDQEGTK